MDGCDACTPSWQAGKMYASCDLLDVYSLLCFQMPEMSQCTSWHAMCKEYPKLPLCSGGTNSDSSGSMSSMPPVMKMYFFTSLNFYLLFKHWTPDSPAQYAGAWFAIFFSAVVYELLSTLSNRMEGYWFRRKVMLASYKGDIFSFWCTSATCSFSLG